MEMCNYCGRPLQQSGIITPLSNGSYALMCHNCFKHLGTCAFCSHAQLGCAFENDPSPIPKQVTQTIRQGNMVMQTVIKNPARVEALCTKCTCFDITSQFCGRDDNLCLSYREWEPSLIPDESLPENPTKN